MWNLRTPSDHPGKSPISLGTTVMLLRASAMAVVLLFVISAYSKPPHDTKSADARTLTNGAAAHAVSDEQAQCEQRYAAWAAEGGTTKRPDAMVDCIESEP